MTEPTTAITDGLLAAVSLTAWWRTLRFDRSDPQSARRLWAWGFATLALAALAGGAYHGFAASMGPRASAALWKSTVYLIGVMDLLLLCGSFAAALRGGWRWFAMAAALVKFLLYAAWIAGHDQYLYVVYDYAPSMLAILLIHAIPGSLGRERAARWILAGLVVSSVAAVVQVSGISLHEDFNHNDLYHVIQIGAIVLFHRGALRLRDRR